MNARTFSVARDLQFIAALVHKAKRPVVCRLQGRSMGDSLPDGALIRIQPLNGEDCELGQVVVFDVNGALVAHRIVYLGKGPESQRFILTHGDGRIPCDPPIERTAVLGVVQEYCRDGTWRLVERRASRSLFNRLRAQLHVGFIRMCMQISIPLAQWIARSVLACSSVQTFMNSFHASRNRTPRGIYAGDPADSMPFTIAGVDHINMNVLNLEESIDFYHRLFGTDGEIKDGGEQPQRWRIIGIPQKIYFCLYEVKGSRFDPNALHINHIGFYTPNFDGMVRRVKALGLPVEFEGKPLEWKNRNGVSRSLYVKDPNGYLIEFAEKLGGGLD